MTPAELGWAIPIFIVIVSMGIVLVLANLIMLWIIRNDTPPKEIADLAAGYSSASGAMRPRRYH
jgi:hypothetical protein